MHNEGKIVSKLLCFFCCFYLVLSNKCIKNTNWAWNGIFTRGKYSRSIFILEYKIKGSF